MFGKRLAGVRFGRHVPHNADKAVRNKSKYFDAEGWKQWLLFVENFYRNYHFAAPFSNSFGTSCVEPVFVNKKFDNRPYVRVKLMDRSIVALLDSGANASIVGSEGLKIISLCNVRVKRSVSKYVTTADGTRQNVVGVADLPIFVNDTCRILRVLVVPKLKHSLILGSDFCRRFNLRIDFKHNLWEVRDNENIGISIVDGIESKPYVKEIRARHDLTAEQVERVDDVLALFKALNRDGQTGRTNKLVHHIDTGDAKPIKQRQYLLSPYMLGHLNKELDKMLELGVVEPSESAWSSPVLLVKKKDDTYRFCFDGRKLNSVTKKDSYPMPFVDRILNMLRDARYISSVDLRSAFWQIPLDEGSKEKTAFAVPGRGLYHFTVLPFGLSNAAQVQQRLMDAIFGPALEPHIFVYLDDIILT